MKLAFEMLVAGAIFYGLATVAGLSHTPGWHYPAYDVVRHQGNHHQ